ncbi:hypothetical protein [Undibacterium sp. TS12]|nr:hypothetical protein [Undibacterium sp. TS12]
MNKPTLQERLAGGLIGLLVGDVLACHMNSTMRLSYLKPTSSD